MPSKHYGRARARWVDENGRRRSQTFDDWRSAKYAEEKAKAEVEEIRRGLRAPVPPSKTFDEACDYWLAKRAVVKRSRKDDESMIRLHLRPWLGKLLLKDIGVQHGDEYIASHVYLDKKTVANHLTLLLSILRAAVDLGWLEKVPRIRKPRIRLFSADYSYLRTQDEITRLLVAAREEEDVVHAMYATAIYTGMRAGELAGLRWADVSFERRLITVQRSFDGPTKAEDVRYVPILDALLPILRARRLQCPLPIVFPNQGGGMYRPSGRIFQEVFHRVLERAGMGRVERKGKLRSYVRFHDLRHTFASNWVARGGDLFKLQRILGHKDMKMTLRYAHLAPEAFAADYGRLGGAHQSTVIDLGQRAG